MQRITHAAVLLILGIIHMAAVVDMILTEYNSKQPFLCGSLSCNLYWAIVLIYGIFGLLSLLDTGITIVWDPVVLSQDQVYQQLPQPCSKCGCDPSQHQPMSSI